MAKDGKTGAERVDVMMIYVLIMLLGEKSATVDLLNIAQEEVSSNNLPIWA